MAKRTTRPRAGAPSSRREKALETRRRMLGAALELFAARGFAGTTMDAIAERAGVAVQTLYFTFHTKGAILSEVFGASIVGLSRWDPRAAVEVQVLTRRTLAELHAWFPPFEAEPDASRALRLFVDASVDILARASPLAAILRAAAISDPEVRVAEAAGERRREQSYALVVEVLAEKRRLRRGTSRRRATDVLLALLSSDTYRELAQVRGWSPVEIRRFFEDVLAHQLFEPTR